MDFLSANRLWVDSGRNCSVQPSLQYNSDGKAGPKPKRSPETTTDTQGSEQVVLILRV